MSERRFKQTLIVLGLVMLIIVCSMLSSVSPPIAARTLKFSPVELILIIAYMVPAIVAAVRRHHNQNSIFLLNLLLGWTGLGWIGALIWSVSFVKRPSVS